MSTDRLNVEAAGFEGDERKTYVRRMFDSIAGTYDSLNHILSGGFDIIWRKRAAKRLTLSADMKHLDLATGTGDFAFEIKRRFDCNVTGIDISQNMLNIAEQKKARRDVQGITFINGDAEQLPFPDQSFHSVSIGFGIRNFGDKKAALKEIKRVLKPGGRLIILEFAKNRTPIVGDLMDFYFRRILPLIGRMLSKHKDAYMYLPESVNTFMTQAEFTAAIAVEFSNASYKNFMFGICTLFIADRDETPS